MKRTRRIKLRDGDLAKVIPFTVGGIAWEVDAADDAENFDDRTAKVLALGEWCLELIKSGDGIMLPDKSSPTGWIDCMICERDAAVINAAVEADAKAS